MTKEELVALARQAAQNAYAPYSGFRVGAALLGASGKVYLGCNVENAAFTPSICAERTAFSRAVSDGERSFQAIAIVGGKEGVLHDFCPPCGVCRQVMAEFCPGTFAIHLGREDGKISSFTLEELLPPRFGGENLR